MQHGDAPHRIRFKSGKAMAHIGSHTPACVDSEEARRHKRTLTSPSFPCIECESSDFKYFVGLHRILRCLAQTEAGLEGGQTIDVEISVQVKPTSNRGTNTAANFLATCKLCWTVKAFIVLHCLSLCRKGTPESMKTRLTG